MIKTYWVLGILIFFLTLLMKNNVKNDLKEKFKTSSFCRKIPKECKTDVSCKDIEISEKITKLANPEIFVKTVNLTQNPSKLSEWETIFEKKNKQGIDVEIYDISNSNGLFEDLLETKNIQFINLKTKSLVKLKNNSANKIGIIFKGLITPKKTGNYKFWTKANNGAKLYFYRDTGKKYLYSNGWEQPNKLSGGTEIYLKKNISIRFELQYHEWDEKPYVQLWWKVPNSSKKQIIPKAIFHKLGYGYCTKRISHITNVNNRSVCSGLNKNIGFQYTIVFPVIKTSTYSFDIGMDFEKGGMVVLDNSVVRKTTTKLKNSKDLDFTKTLTRGIHVLKIYGGGCCDDKNSCKFKVDDGSWKYVTLKNLSRHNMTHVVDNKYNICGFSKVGTGCGLKKNKNKLENYSNDANVQTFKHCYDLCKNDPNCQSFYWSHEKQQCHLKNVSSEATALNENSNSVCFSRNNKKYVNKKQKTFKINTSENLTKTVE